VHDRTPPEVLLDQAAAHVVDVAGIAVVGRAEGDDGLERRRPERRRLQRVEAAPGLAHHAHRAAAPGLRRQPGDDLQGVGLLLRQVFVVQQAVGLARAAHVDAHRGIAVAGEIVVHRLVAAAHVVALAVGDVFEDGRDRVVPGVLRQPDARRQAGAVGQRDPRVLDTPYPAREILDYLHTAGVTRHDLASSPLLVWWNRNRWPIGRADRCPG
jgi:hypothetical protein